MFAIVAGNVLSLPGILGIAIGMTTRSIGLAILFGALVGVAETVIFDGFDFAAIDRLEFAMSVLVGVISGATGCAIRCKGATV